MHEKISLELIEFQQELVHCSPITASILQLAKSPNRYATIIPTVKQSYTPRMKR